MKRAKVLLFVASVLALSILVSACNGSGQTPATGSGANTPTESGANKPTESGGVDNTPLKDTLTIAQPLVVNSLDPLNSPNVQTSNVVTQLYNGLLYQDKDGIPQPDLAESMEVSADGLSMTFKLRQDVKFTNGDPLTVEDVVFSIERAMANPWQSSQLASIKDIEAPDDSTVVIHLNTQDRILPITLASNYLFIVHKKTVEAAGENFGSGEVVGTGPYKVKEWALSEKIVLERNEDYFKPLPQIKTITYVPIADQNTTLIALQSGDVDFTYQGITSSARDTVLSDPNLQLLEDASTASRMIFINTKKPPLDNVLVRQAISYAIDRESLAMLATGGAGVPTYTALSEQNMSQYTKGVPIQEYDVEKAKALLTEAGYPDGFEITAITREIYRRYSEVLQDQLAQVGIVLKIEVVDAGTQDTMMVSGDYFMSPDGVGLSYPDPDALLAKIYDSQGIYQLTFYSNAEVDRLLRAAKTTYNKDELISYYNQALKIVNEDLPLIPCYYEKANFAYRAGLNIPFFPAYGLYRVEDFAWTK